MIKKIYSNISYPKSSDNKKSHPNIINQSCSNKNSSYPKSSNKNSSYPKSSNKKSSYPKSSIKKISHPRVRVSCTASPPPPPPLLLPVPLKASIHLQRPYLTADVIWVSCLVRELIHVRIKFNRLAVLQMLNMLSGWNSRRITAVCGDFLVVALPFSILSFFELSCLLPVMLMRE